MVSGDQEPSRAGPRAGDKRSRSVTIQSFGSDRPYIGPFGRTPFVRWSVIPPPKPSQPRIIRPAPRMVYRPPAAQQNSVPCDYEEGGEAHADNADPLRGHGALVGSSGEQQTATSSGDRTVSSSQHAATFQPTADRDQGFSQAAAAPDGRPIPKPQDWLRSSPSFNALKAVSKPHISTCINSSFAAVCIIHDIDSRTRPFKCSFCSFNDRLQWADRAL